MTYYFGTYSNYGHIGYTAGYLVHKDRSIPWHGL